MLIDGFKGKKVFVTGHTGFKGAWLVAWLQKLGATVRGFADRVPTQPSIFDVLGLESKIEHQFADVRDLDALVAAIDEFKPDFVFHLAAQPIVSVSYQDPVGTVTTNVVGTVNVLEALRRLDRPCCAVFVTSDKCYENVEWVWGYKETDHLGGRDIYSGSKGAAEVVIHAYHQSFFAKPGSNVRLATGRAGNVIGGGDWAPDRIVADCMRNWSAGQPVDIRCPSATRPWQHVLEPLSGYLNLAIALADNAALSGESFNFGPRAEQNRTVLDLLKDLSHHWGHDSQAQAWRVTGNTPFHEAGLLKLNCDKALFHLRWEASLDYEACVRMVSEWYRAYYQRERDMYELTLQQIEDYEQAAKKRGLKWTR
ncbi:CDP-glucose 4,6-dehydratase [Paraburkholderia lycopersici]|uniref:CDP-glucose 4,6-dehydratase n=1 Tax=Paraburkholderia lycopersici TaxID=416944 RepID=A0A1G6T6F8_9BURK|nr:CDP-glucose 4,6-dehydratase [Paraburkholderia lycopersici]SDD24609.1 CDP-glucose 4,6-dehydratase [Paraburkholderia lycopersici]